MNGRSVANGPKPLHELETYRPSYITLQRLVDAALHGESVDRLRVMLDVLVRLDAGLPTDSLEAPSATFLAHLMHLVARGLLEPHECGGWLTMRDAPLADAAEALLRDERLDGEMLRAGLLLVIGRPLPMKYRNALDRLRDLGWQLTKDVQWRF
jgi:hypothetical protein